jgi:hypothetical protein
MILLNWVVLDSKIVPWKVRKDSLIQLDWEDFFSCVDLNDLAMNRDRSVHGAYWHFFEENVYDRFPLDQEWVEEVDGRTPILNDYN